MKAVALAWFVLLGLALWLAFDYNTAWSLVPGVLWIIPQSVLVVEWFPR
jgi:hypothetical protein